MRTSITLAAIALSLTLSTAIVAPVQAAFVEGTNGPDLLIGKDDDNDANPLVAPAGPAVQSLANTDIIDGRNGDDVLIGLLGNDVLLGGKGADIMIGGTEQGSTPNSDFISGGDNDDVALWRGGDGSETYLGGRGTDALVFGNIDRDANNVPIVNPVHGRFQKTGLPSADLTGQGGFCRLEDVRGGELGYDFLVRFFVRATGNLAVTLRVADVEHVFCTSEAGGAITFADLTKAAPDFVEISLDDVKKRNKIVSRIIR